MFCVHSGLIDSCIWEAYVSTCSRVVRPSVGACCMRVQKEFWVMAEIVQVLAEEDQVVVRILDPAYEIAMAEAEDAAGVTPRDPSAPSPRSVHPSQEPYQ